MLTISTLHKLWKWGVLNHLKQEIDLQQWVQRVICIFLRTLLEWWSFWKSKWAHAVVADHYYWNACFGTLEKIDRPEMQERLRHCRANLSRAAEIGADVETPCLVKVEPHHRSSHILFCILNAERLSVSCSLCCFNCPHKGRGPIYQEALSRRRWPSLIFPQG